MSTGIEERIIVALDVDTASEAEALMQSLDGVAAWVKIGLQLFTREGAPIVRLARERGFHVFLDLKFHDIPNTVAGAVRSVATLGAAMTTIHLSGGPAMVRAAAAAAREGGVNLLGVSVLTSMDADELRAVGVDAEPERQVARLAELAAAAELFGVVASPLEISSIRESTPDLKIVTPGIRPSGAESGDQRRISTPAQAIAAGADFLVVGRPVTAAPDPREAFLQIVREMPSN